MVGKTRLTALRRTWDVTRLRGRRLRSHLTGSRIRTRELWLTLPNGDRVFAHLHAPAGDGRLPGVLLIPGLAGAGTDFDGLGAVVTADEVAARGCVCLHFDPPGTGRSWGTYDYAGPGGHAATLAALEFLARCPRVELERLGVLAISMGVAMAAPVVVRHGERLGVRWLIDWEGPADRAVITSFGRIMVPAMGHGLDDEAYWRPREAVRHVGALRCSYLREQSALDHAQGAYTGHAVDMVNAALTGGCPDVRLNGERLHRPLGPRSLPEVRWRQGGRREANRSLLETVEGLVTD